MKRAHVIRICGYVLSGLVCFLLYGYLYTAVFKFKLPKTAILERRNAKMISGFNVLEQHLEDLDDRLLAIQMRDNAVYRPIFGMEQITQDTRNAGFGNAEARYAGFGRYANGPLLASAKMKLDILSKKAVIQSRSFDEVELMARRAGEMSQCIPNISPVDMHRAGVALSSPFGYRNHPIFGDVLRHHGIDIRGPAGLPVYATADGKVVMAEKSYLGYGTCIVIDHGFGYKTRYAHLQKMFVKVGMQVSRGQHIAALGRSGRATGYHLHYEVLYHNAPVNPVSYLDNLTASEYRKLVGGGKI